MTINTLADLMAHFDCCEDDTVATLNRRIYKDTHCGASISVYGTAGGKPYAAHSGHQGPLPADFKLERFSIQTIVEGSDATVDSPEFKVGETVDEDIDTWIAFMEEESSRLWAIANGNDEMLPEYDLTGGERGKYAERYKAGVTVNVIKPKDSK